jgi:biuret amidohydrolase
VNELLIETASPGAWPVTGPTPIGRIALVVIDLQRDFVDDRGWFGSLGFDLSDCQQALEVVQPLVGAMRDAGAVIVLTRQGNAADLSDLPLPRIVQGRRLGSPVGTPGPLGRALVRGETGWGLVDALAVEPDDIVVDKPGFSSFFDSDLHDQLQRRGVTALVITGVTANVCVLATLLAAVDHGYDCLTLVDGIGAANAQIRDTVLGLVQYQGGLFGCTASAGQLMAAVHTAAMS